MVYPNLEAEMARIKLTRKDVAKVLNLNLSTITPKLNIQTRIKYCEALAIRDNLFPTLDIDYLFATKADYLE